MVVEVTVVPVPVGSAASVYAVAAAERGPDPPMLTPAARRPYAVFGASAVSTKGPEAADARKALSEERNRLYELAPLAKAQFQVTEDIPRAVPAGVPGGPGRAGRG